jgi:hypothetical protein
MARIKSSLWQRHRYKINGLVLILPFYFLYQSLFPVFPDSLNTQEIGEFTVTPTPYDLGAPYLHDGHYTKDFMMTFSEGDIKYIRQAYVNIGKAALPLSQLQLASEGVLHGSQHGQEVHAISPAVIKAEHKLWLTIESWQGKQLTVSWNLPKKLLAE